MAIGPSEDIGPVQKTIDSLAAQAEVDIELVVKTLGNHLRPEIEKYCSDINHIRLRLLAGQDNGIYDAFNICMHAATGEYIIYLGCGDTLADAFVGAAIFEFAKDKNMPPIIYGPVLIENNDGQIFATFNNSTFHGKRRKLPWRNPCHSQGLIYRRDWLINRPFRTDVGPLADLVHTYEHQVAALAAWLPRPISIFVTGGISNQKSNTAFRARLMGISENCKNFKHSYYWRPVALLVCHANHLFRK